MIPDLVPPSRRRPCLHETPVVAYFSAGRSLDASELGQRGFAIGHGLSLPLDRERKRALNNSYVIFTYFPLLKPLVGALVRLLGSRKKHDPRGLAIDPMHGPNRPERGLGFKRLVFSRPFGPIVNYPEGLSMTSQSPVC